MVEARASSAKANMCYYTIAAATLVGRTTADAMSCLLGISLDCLDRSIYYCHLGILLGYSHANHLGTNCIITIIGAAGN